MITVMYEQRNDGIDHINIYSKGWTELGRFMSNFYHSPVVTEDGEFQSIEGYWYWLGTGDDNLRNMNGYNAKKYGKGLKRDRSMPKLEFQRKIREACWSKLHSNKKILEEFTNSTLPFTHYYVFGLTIKDGGTEWLVAMWEYFRKFIKNGYRH